jgi:hypothetical protein
MPPVKEPRKDKDTSFIQARLVKNVLSEWKRAAFDYENDFLEMFCKGDAWTLIEATWGPESMKFVYIIDSGSHIVNSVPMKEWLKFYDRKAGQERALTEKIEKRFNKAT